MALPTPRPMLLKLLCTLALMFLITVAVDGAPMKKQDAYVTNCIPGKKRICNSRDAPDAAEKGICKANLLEVPELVIGNQNWQSGWHMALLAQILLSEVLQVPTVIESYYDDAEVDAGRADFHNAKREYGGSNKGYGWDAMARASEDFTCEDATSKGEKCIHAILEIWDGQKVKSNNMILEQKAERAGSLGVLGMLSLYVNSQVLEKYSSMVTYRGLKDKTLTPKAFPKPLNLKEYCDLPGIDCAQNPSCDVSNPTESTCTSAMGCTFLPGGMYGPETKPIAEARCLPTHKDVDLEADGSKYFVADKYLGQFIEDGIGHIISAPCDWTSYTASQIYNNDLHLTMSGGTVSDTTPNGEYTYSEMLQVYSAAAHQRKGIILWWWEPEPIFEKFRYEGKWYKLEKVYLPPFNNDCDASRPQNRCASTLKEAAVFSGAGSGNRGEPGLNGNSHGCDYKTELLNKVVSTGVRQNLPQAFMVLANMLVSSTDQLNMLADSAYTESDDRDVVCQWVKDNQNKGMMWSVWMPDSSVYPQKLNILESSAETGTVVIILCATLMVSIVGFAILMFKKRSSRLIREGSLTLTLVTAIGTLITCTVPIAMSFTINATTCTLQPWLSHLGFSLTYLPLQFKTQRVIALADKKAKDKAIAAARAEHITETTPALRNVSKKGTWSASQRMLDATAEVKGLMTIMGVIIFFQILGLLIWSVVSTPYAFTEDVVDGNIVNRVTACKMQEIRYAFIVVDFVIIGYGCLLAYSTRAVDPKTPGFGATKFIAMSLYNSFLLTAIRTVFMISGFLDRTPSANLAVQGILVLLAVMMVEALVLYPITRPDMKGRNSQIAPKDNKYTPENVEAQ